jgi:hypothetical protein
MEWKREGEGDREGANLVLLESNPLYNDEYTTKITAVILS